MSSVESILKKVRKIEIKARGLTQNVFSGAYHTTFKGRGISFSEIREYIPGDDIRQIDWKVSAKMKKTYVKVFHEERELTAMLMIDVGSTMFFGSFHELKKDYIAEIAALLSFSAIANNDKIGLLLYADKVIRYIPPNRGKSHVLRLIREIVSVEYPMGVASNPNLAIDFLNKIHKRKTICFWISDFQHSIQELKLRILSQKHDLIGMHIYDKLEQNMPDVGWIRVMDMISNQEKLINTSDANLRKMNRELFDKNVKHYKDLFLKHNASWLSMDVEQDYVKMLQIFFMSRRR